MPPHSKGKKTSRYHDDEDGDDGHQVVVEDSEDDHAHDDVKKEKTKKKKHQHHHRHRHHHHRRHDEDDDVCGAMETDDGDLLNKSKKRKKKDMKDSSPGHRGDDSDDHHDCHAMSTEKKRKDKKHHRNSKHKTSREDDSEDHSSPENDDVDVASSERKRKKKKKDSTREGDLKCDKESNPKQGAKTLSTTTARETSAQNHVDENVDGKDGPKSQDGCSNGSESARSTKKKSHSISSLPALSNEPAVAVASSSSPSSSPSSSSNSRAAVAAPAAAAMPGSFTTHAPQSRRQTSTLSYRAALAVVSSCQLQPSEFHDFVCARAFDVISGGMYRKFLVQSRAAKEDWAFNVYTSIGKVQKLIKALSGIVHTMKCAEENTDISRKGGGNGPMLFSSVLTEVMNCSSPPCRKRVETVRTTLDKFHHQIMANTIIQKQDTSSELIVPVRCSVTGVELDEDCIEVRPMTKSTSFVTPLLQSKDANKEDDDAGTFEKPSSSCSVKKVRHVTLHPPIVVHPNLEHFFQMFWFVCKIEHIVRNMARSWMDENGIACGGGDNTGGGDDDKRKDVSADRSSSSGSPPDAMRALDGTRSAAATSSEVDVSVAPASRSGSSGAVAAAAAAGTEEDNTQAACERFSTEQASVIRDMHGVLRHGASHVIESLYAHSSLASFKVDAIDDSKKAGGSNHHRVKQVFLVYFCSSFVRMLFSHIMHTCACMCRRRLALAVPSMWYQRRSRRKRRRMALTLTEPMRMGLNIMKTTILLRRR